MLPLIEESEQARGLNDQSGFFIRFFRGNLVRRVADISPPARQSPSSVIQLLSDQQDLRAFPNDHSPDVNLGRLVPVLGGEDADDLLQWFFRKLFQQPDTDRSYLLVSFPVVQTGCVREPRLRESL